MKQNGSFQETIARIGQKLRSSRKGYFGVLLILRSVMPQLDLSFVASLAPVALMINAPSVNRRQNRFCMPQFQKR